MIFLLLTATILNLLTINAMTIHSYKLKNDFQF